MDGRLQAWQPHGVGLQISSGVDDEVSVFGSCRGCGPAMPRIASGNLSEPGNGDLRWVDQSGSCSHADWHPAADIGVAGSAIPEREEFA